MQIDKKQHNPLLSIQHSINVVGSMREKGQSYKWCRGMIRHYIEQISELGMSYEQVRCFGMSLTRPATELVTEVIAIDLYQDTFPKDLAHYLMAIIGMDEFTSLNGRRYSWPGIPEKN